MLSFVREGRVVKVQLNTGIKCAAPMWILDLTCSSEVIAESVKRQLQDEFRRRCEATWDTAYMRGWDDRKKRKCPNSPEFTWLAE